MNHIRTFKDKSLLLKVLNARVSGMSVTRISKEFQVNHSTIIYHCNKWKVAPNGKPLVLSDLTGEIIKVDGKYDHLLDEPVNMGKCYKTYLKRAHYNKKTAWCGTYHTKHTLREIIDVV